MSSLKLFGSDTIQRFAKRLIVWERCPCVPTRDAALAVSWVYGDREVSSFVWRRWTTHTGLTSMGKRIYDATGNGKWR